MTQASIPYAVTLAVLEAGVRVAADDQVQEQPSAGRPDPNPRAAAPGRERFSSGVWARWTPIGGEFKPSRTSA